METTVNVRNTRSKSLRNIDIHRDSQPLQATPKERLHSVEEFVEKLEQAVFQTASHTQQAAEHHFPY